MIARTRVASIVLLANICMAGWIMLGKALLLLAGHDQTAFRLTGAIVSEWPAHVRAFAVAELAVAIAMATLSVSLFRRKRASIWSLAFCLLVFMVVAFMELSGHLSEVGLEPFPTILASKAAAWTAWLALNLVLLRSHGRLPLDAR